MTDKEINYEEEVVKDMRETYLANPTRETVDLLAFKYGKSVRSIVGKLSKEGIYKRPSYTTKRGETPVSKDEIVEMIASAIDTPSELLEGLEKAPKQALRLILKALDPDSDENFKPKGV
jgi:hypothetical protein